MEEIKSKTGINSTQEVEFIERGGIDQRDVTLLGLFNFFTECSDQNPPINLMTSTPTGSIWCDCITKYYCVLDLTSQAALARNWMMAL